MFVDDAIQHNGALRARGFRQRRINRVDSSNERGRLHPASHPHGTIALYRLGWRNGRISRGKDSSEYSAQSAAWHSSEYASRCSLCSGRFFRCFLQDLYVLRYCSRGNQLAVIEQRSLRFSHHSHFASWRRRRSDQYRFFQIREVKRLRITERKKYEQENEGSLSCQGNQKIDEPSRLLEIGVLQ